MWAETAFTVKSACAWENASLLASKLFLVRMSAAILQNLADTAIREAIACCIHVLRLGKGFIWWIPWRIAREAGWARMCYTLCVLSSFLWILLTQTVEGVKVELMRCHRASESEYWPSYGPFSEEIPSIVCVCTLQRHDTRAFLWVFEIFFAQKIDPIKSLKMWCRSHSESQN